MNQYIQFSVLLLFLNTKNVYSANILYVAAIASPSHHIWNRALAFGLANKGHNVTHIGPDEDKLAKPPNYTHILLDGFYDNFYDNDFDLIEMASGGSLKTLFDVQFWYDLQCERGLNSKGLQRLLNYPSDFKFDLIIYDITADSCLYPLIHKFNYPPTVGATAFLLPTYTSFIAGNQLFPAYIPWYGVHYTTEMNFVERTWNFIFTYLEIALRYISQTPKEQKAASKIFGENIPSLETLTRHMTLFLANTDPILDYPQPIPPNIIPVGGLHTRKSKALPQDIQVILDNAKDGVVVFSLGTNVRSDKLDKTTRKAILDAFSKIPQTVIWKFESDIEDLPKNVIVRKFLPQNDILGHPNVKLFIGHGGALSTQEAMFHGVPMIVVPFIVDQHLNARRIVQKGLGLTLDFRRITSEYFLNTLKEALNNPLYSKNMKRVSTLFRDRPETPLERAIFWVEYTLRHGGADFLSTPGRDLPFYKSSSLDVVTFLIFLTSVVVYVLYKTILLILRPFQTKKKVKTH